MTINTTLNEGVKYFKYSDRIKSYIDKINKKKIKNDELNTIVSELNSLQKRFSSLEIEYKKASSKEELLSIKKQWKVLEAKNDKILSMVRKNEIKKAAIVVGIFSLILTVLFIIKHGIDKNVEKIESFDLDKEKTNLDNADLNRMEKHKDALEKAYNTFKGFDMPREGTYSKADLIKILKDECDKQKFPFEIAKEVVTAESSWNPRAISTDSSSVGLMQLNLNYKNEFATKYFSGDKSKFNPFDPKMNVESGIKYLKYLIKHNDGDLRNALLDYNAGPNRTETTKGTLRYADRIMIALNKK